MFSWQRLPRSIFHRLVVTIPYSRVSCLGGECIKLLPHTHARAHTHTAHARAHSRAHTRTLRHMNVHVITLKWEYTIVPLTFFIFSSSWMQLEHVESQRARMRRAIAEPFASSAQALKLISKEELQKHNKKDDCWIVIDSMVYTHTHTPRTPRTLFTLWHDRAFCLVCTITQTYIQREATKAQQVLVHTQPNTHTNTRTHTRSLMTVPSQHWALPKFYGYSQRLTLLTGMRRVFIPCRPSRRRLRPHSLRRPRHHRSLLQVPIWACHVRMFVCVWGSVCACVCVRVRVRVRGANADAGAGAGTEF